MLIPIECRTCGRRYATEARYAGRKITCKGCGALIRVPGESPGPGPSAGEGPTPPIRFPCRGCGKALSAPPQHAGRKSRCKGCGAVFRIPDAAGVAPAPVRPARSSAPPSSGILDLELDGPAAPRVAPPPPPRSDEPEVLPARLGDPAALDEEQKRRIARRAARAERNRAFEPRSVLSVSFGTVVVVAVFGWRVHRALTRFRPAVEGDDEAVAAAPADPGEVGREARRQDETVRRMIAIPTSVEAREWLDASRHPNHVIFEMGNRRALEMVEGFYRRGAEKVYVIDAEASGDVVLSAMIGVRLPAEPARRRECLLWQAEFSEGDPPAPDVGQQYLLITTD